MGDEAVAAPPILHNWQHLASLGLPPLEQRADVRDPSPEVALDLIADDVGIGKTIEACLIARELLDRNELRRLAVLCPPHLAEQWQEELDRKFHIEAELVLAKYGDPARTRLCGRAIIVRHLPSTSGGIALADRRTEGHHVGLHQG